MHSAHPDLPATSALLLEGGDARIALGTDGRFNQYGCPPRPDPTLLSFGSSTASVISEAAFQAAEILRKKIYSPVNSLPQNVIYGNELQRIRYELKDLCGLSAMPDLDIVFAASGTDLHLIASQITSGSIAHPTRVIMVGAEETGSCVPTALAGKHFSTRSALGLSVAEGTCLATDDKHVIEITSVAIRQPDGHPRPIDAIDADVTTLVNQAVALQRRVLLILVDVSKTGMIAPSPACAAALHEQHPDSIDVLVDACQFRIAPATLRAYLEQDFMVALTGSKFVSGPTFSGALLLPAAVTQRLRAYPLSPALSAYCARADWPDHWPHANHFPALANFGLLLRWEAALTELRAFRAVPDHEIASFLQNFARAIRLRLQSQPCLQELPVPLLARQQFAQNAEGPSWDQYQTIFPFLLYQASNRPGNQLSNQPLRREQTRHVYRQLQQDAGDGIRCQLGQPVACGSRDGIAVSALRLCLSARLIVEATAGQGRQAAAVIERAMFALDKTAILVENNDF